MTINEFLEELKKYGIKFKVNKLENIRDENGHCPICSLIKAKGLNKSPQNICARIYAIDLLNLRDEEVSCLVSTADNFISSVSFDPNLRKRLIDDYCTIP